MFTAKKSSKHKQTQRKYQYTLRNLKAWAVRNGRHYLADLTESDLEKYQASWTLKSNYAKRNEQERLRSFFRYCCASAEIKLAYNPTAQLEHFNTTSDEPEDPYTENEFKAIVAAVDRVPGWSFLAHPNRERPNERDSDLRFRPESAAGAYAERWQSSSASR